MKKKTLGQLVVKERKGGRMVVGKRGPKTKCKEEGEGREEERGRYGKTPREEMGIICFYESDL